MYKCRSVEVFKIRLFKFICIISIYLHLIMVKKQTLHDLSVSKYVEILSIMVNIPSEIERNL
jgi:hypothetical protein